MVNRLAGKKVIGIKQTQKALKTSKCRTLYIAKDADLKLTESIINMAKEKSVEILYIDTMKELGKLCGIDVGAATALILE